MEEDNVLEAPKPLEMTVQEPIEQNPPLAISLAHDRPQTPLEIFNCCSNDSLFYLLASDYQKGSIRLLGYKCSRCKKEYLFANDVEVYVLVNRFLEAYKERG